MEITREKVDKILSIMPENVRACYTGQSILAYCPDPTFTWEEINSWPDVTDIDIFAYTHSAQASIVQAYISDGWMAMSSIEEFKSERIRFWNPNKKFNLQTVKLEKLDYPILNITWSDGVEDVLDCIKRFDMDYLMVGMDCKTKIFADLRSSNHRVANVNTYNQRFDPVSVEPSFWYRQFERVPKGYSRGIDTRPVAKQYLQWIEQTLEEGDRALSSKTREYSDKMMAEAIKPLVQTGVPEEQAKAMYHMFRGEMNTWEAQAIKHQAMADRIKTWLESVEND